MMYEFLFVMKMQSILFLQLFNNFLTQLEFLLQFFLIINVPVLINYLKTIRRFNRFIMTKPSKFWKELKATAQYDEAHRI